MKLTLFIEICLFSLAAYGWQLPPKGHEWHPPVPGDSEPLHYLFSPIN
jgi:hypothetical protein